MDPQITQIPQKESDLLPLNAEGRVVCWRIKGTSKTRRHIFARPDKQTVREFFRESTPRLDSAGREAAIARIFAAPLALYDKLISKVEGYTVEGGAELTTLPEWKTRIPETDRHRAIQWLTRVVPSEASDAADLETEFDVVRLDALFNESDPGVMRWFTGLVHRFRPMTVADEAELRGRLTKHYTVGGTRDGATRPAVRGLVLLGWYDRMIESVEGYGLFGKPLADKQEICEHMEPFHKIAAVERWLAGETGVEEPLRPGESPSSEDEGEEED